ncbi:YbhB/YbcL family Raf kinase inhibitor-like protein [Curvibacter sp. CHRR-16]|uniref:YbhB/YbcL family Raf kinase inhibitor-like protein n=1 Tax=Curvibacter sp. CHRR-16 TaxID=2835872 RepID=UPI001BDA38BD|nr:YbhB/YbcL family Raf kinase inhibitor-like protein [Curvibacter sp. CHRR-16]MBT0570018.1 YbhB/YbcL family Raf kinase inhibitor-like protein [Curvibacter sp. CHRR-16]
MKHTLLAAALLGASALSYSAGFAVHSPEIKAASPMAKKFEFNGFGCAGDNQSPTLQWSHVPAGTKSFAVTVYDPDAPTGSGWWHWLVINVPADVSALEANAGAEGGAHLPAGASHVRNDYGVSGWGGVCPPPGDKPHRYIFKVHALKVDKIDLPSNATAALAGYMINANTLATARFTATYGRPAAKP